MTINHTELAHQIHADNIRAGWWSDLKTGESIIHARNRPEMLMLIVSELSEASEGWAGDLEDDKLPHYKMYRVELADAAIRIYDLLGCDAGTRDFSAYVDGVADAYCGGVDAYCGVADYFDADLVEMANLMEMVNLISRAMEGYRKGDTGKYLTALTDCLGYIWGLSRCHSGPNLMEVIEAKRSFNRNRADHKLENRRADGGKMF